MPVHSSEDQAAPLDIYLAYDYLPASQYARLLHKLDELYQSIVRDLFDDDKSFLLDYYYHDRRTQQWPRQPWLPLCIDSVETGQSISVRFAAKGESGGVAWRERDLDIVLPRSTAPLCAIGAMLTGGAWSYEHYLDAQFKKAQIENVQAQSDATRAQGKLTAAQVELTRAQTAEILAKQAAPKQSQRRSTNRSTRIEIQSHVQNFYSIINQPNISRAEVNGIDAREISDREN